MFLEALRIPTSKVVERPGRNKKITEKLPTGISARGFSRHALRYKNYNGEVGDEPVKLNANYDETDELLRRVRIRMDTPYLRQPKFDERIVVAPVGQYLLEADDSSPARFS